MTSDDDGVLGGPIEGDERKSGHPDGAERWSRSRTYGADGAVVTFGSMLAGHAWKGIKWARLRMRNISRWRERNGVQPSSSRASEFTTNSTE